MRVVVVIGQNLHVRHGDAHDCAAQLLAELTTLCDRPGSGIVDCAVDVDEAKSIVALEITAGADSQDAAVRKALTALRSAIHRAGSAAPVWPVGPELDRLMQSIERTMTVERLTMAIA
jgi:hypothetical protein